jgi:hypothetical protein
MEHWRVCSPLVADSHHLDEDLSPDLDPHQSEKPDQNADPQHWIRYRYRPSVLRIRDPRWIKNQDPDPPGRTYRIIFPTV